MVDVSVIAVIQYNLLFNILYMLYMICKFRHMNHVCLIVTSYQLNPKE